MSQTFWKFWAWLSIVCGLAAYFFGWMALFSGTTYWGIPNQFWFYDAIAAAMFGVFFLIYAAHWGKK